MAAKRIFLPSYRRCAVAVCVLLLLLGGCKPRTRRSESENGIRQAIALMMMGEQQKNIYLENVADQQREVLMTEYRRLKQMTGDVEYRDFFLGMEVSMKASLENGRLKWTKGVFDHGSRAIEYYAVINEQIIDSAIRFYPNGVLFSRRVTTVDSTRRVYDEFHSNGTIRSRNINNYLYSWYDTGVLSGRYVFSGEQVGERTLWHNNGKIKEISYWVNDTMNGRYREWDSTGHVLRDMVFAMGKVKATRK